jgi:polyphosphate kinase
VTELRWAIPTAAAAEEILHSPLPLGLRAGPPSWSFYRDIYFDTDSDDLRRRGAICRLRYDVRDRRWLALDAPGVGRCEAAVSELDPLPILSGRAEPARRLRALVDPTRLGARLELDVERRVLTARLPVARVPQCALAFDRITARHQGMAHTFQELVLWRLPGGLIPIAWIGRELTHRHPSLTQARKRVDRAESLIGAAARTTAPPTAPRRVGVIAVAHGRMALCRDGAALALPQEDGTGEEACRRAMRRSFGSAEGEVRLLAVAAAADTRPGVEVWLARRLRRDLTATPPAGLEWYAPADIAERVGSPALRDPLTLTALAMAGRSELVPEWSGTFPTPTAVDLGSSDVGSRLTLSELRVPVVLRRRDTVAQDPERFLNVQISAIEFNARVLALAEDERTPLAARLRFLAIFSTNLDQFFMIHVAALQHQVAAGVVDPSPDGLTPSEQLDAIAIRLRPLLARQYRTFTALVRGPLARAGIALREWSDLDPEEQSTLERRYLDEIAPLLTPKALTRSPGHPFPNIADRRLSLAVMLRDQAQEPVHFAALELPATLPRFLPLGAGARGVVPLETVVRARLASLFPGRDVVAAHAFRLTRGGDILLDETATASFLQAVGEEVRRRPWGPVVRLEVEQAMPPPLRELLQRELRFEESTQHSALGFSDVYEADGPVDLGAVGELAAQASPAGDYPPFSPGDPFANEQSVCAALDRGDVLVHHPYDSFAATFERFIVEAADDPACVAIKLTLYRPGGPSRLGDALRRAAARGKDVSVFVEIKARFDEELNIAWARSLESAGLHVITGLAKLKTHAKIALLVRRVGGRTRRYAHVGSGNYNPDTARIYTDLGLFTADAAITRDIHALFNELTGSSRPPQAEFRRLLVAPTNMLDRFLALIDREADHARKGRGGRIRAKLNGLADATVIDALYRAAQAGVDVNLIVRGACMLRPGVVGLSERIRIVSVLGRFLEHGRIYHFANAGAPEYYIGSADWRPRNLRRRVEVVTPVDDSRARARLDHILDLQLGDPQAWTLQPDGGYAHDPGTDRPAGSQEQLIAAR